MSTTQQVYSVEDLHVSINDIYEQFDVGSLTLDETKELMLLCCNEFVKHNKVSMLNVLKGMGKLEIITVGR
jgi:hypothetical protein